MAVNTLKKLLLAFLFLAGQAQAVTRFYCNMGAGDVPLVSPATTHTAWSQTPGITGPNGSQYFTISTSKTSSAMSDIGDVTYGTNTKDSVLLQIGVSPPIIAQTISGTVKGQWRGRQDLLTDNATLAFALAVVSNNGDTLRGVLLNTKASDASASEFPTTTTNRKVQDGAESASLTLTNVDALYGDRIAVYSGYGENAVLADQQVSLSYGDDSGTDLPEDATTTAANNPWFELSYTVVFETPGTGTQLGAAICADTLFPDADSVQDADWVPSTGTAHWSLLDEAPTGNGCMISNNDSLYVLTQNEAKDLYGMTNIDANQCVGGQIDAIIIYCCARRFAGAATTNKIRLGIRTRWNTYYDSLGGAPSGTTASTVNGIVVPDGTPRLYYWIFNGNIHPSVRGDRWLRDSLVDFKVFLQGTTAAATADMGCHNLFAEVRFSTKSEAIPDSTDVNQEKEISGFSTNEVMIRQDNSFYQSLDTVTSQAYNKMWLFGNTTTGADTIAYGYRATSDSGITWTAFNPDSTNLFSLGSNFANYSRVNNSNNGGISVFHDFNDGRYTDDDSLNIALGGGIANPAVASHRFFRTRGPNVDSTDFRAYFRANNGTSGTINDTITAGTASTLRNGSCLVGYRYKDSIWVAGMWVNNNNAVSNFPGWTRSNDGGFTWASGISNAVDTIYDPNPWTPAGASGQWNGTELGMDMVAWRKFGSGAGRSGPYPAVFVRDRSNCSQVNFFWFHPTWGADTAWGNAKTPASRESLSIYPNKAACSFYGTGASVSRLAAAVVWKDTNDIQAHCVWTSGSRLMHAMVTYAGGNNGTVDTDLVVENYRSQSMTFDLGVYDTNLYVVLRYPDSVSSTSTGVNVGCQSSIWFSVYQRNYDGLGHNAWRAPRPVSFDSLIARPNGQTGTVRQRNAFWVKIPKLVNKNSTYIPVIWNADTTSGVTPRRLYFGRIMKNTAAAAGGTTPLRRRRLIIEKNYRTGMLEKEDEEDSTHWVGLRLPDFTEEK